MRWADEDTVAEAIGGWSNAQLSCRANGHSWKDASVSHRPGLYTILQRCTRNCGCWREADMDEQGYLVSWWKATYPSSGRYLLPAGSGRLPQSGRALVRLARLRNLTVTEVDDE